MKKKSSTGFGSPDIIPKQIEVNVKYKEINSTGFGSQEAAQVSLKII